VLLVCFFDIRGSSRVASRLSKKGDEVEGMLQTYINVRGKDPAEKGNGNKKR